MHKMIADIVSRRVKSWVYERRLADMASDAFGDDARSRDLCQEAISSQAALLRNLVMGGGLEVIQDLEDDVMAYVEIGPAFRWRIFMTNDLSDLSDRLAGMMRRLQSLPMRVVSPAGSVESKGFLGEQWGFCRLRINRNFDERVGGWMPHSECCACDDLFSSSRRDDVLAVWAGASLIAIWSMARKSGIQCVGSGALSLASEAVRRYPSAARAVSALCGVSL